MRILIVLALLLAALPAGADPANWQIGTVHDGDTFDMVAPELPEPLQRLSIRVRGVDTPEVGGRAECALERTLAVQARDFTERFLEGGRLQLQGLAWDKYGGRVLARVLVEGKDLAPALIAAGLGHAYEGKGKREGWCG